MQVDSSDAEELPGSPTDTISLPKQKLLKRLFRNIEEISNLSDKIFKNDKYKLKNSGERWMEQMRSFKQRVGKYKKNRAKNSN